MTEELVPPPSDASPLPAVIEQLGQWRAATIDVVAALAADRQDAEGMSSRLESPKAVYEYIDFFVDAFTSAIAEVEGLAAELAQGPRQAHVDALRQLASNAAVEQRRCGQFRDKWINRPLPYEQVRPLLNHISTTTRDHLHAHRDLQGAAERLQPLLGAVQPPPAPGEVMDRRALFNRMFRRTGEGEK